MLGSLGGLADRSIFLLLGDGLRVRLVPWLISYAVGTLLGVALLALLPEALALAAAAPWRWGRCSAACWSFFLLEKLVLWRHCHDRTSARSTPAARRRSSSSATRSTRSSTAR